MMTIIIIVWYDCCLAFGWIMHFIHCPYVLRLGIAWSVWRFFNFAFPFFYRSVNYVPNNILNMSAFYIFGIFTNGNTKNVTYCFFTLIGFFVKDFLIYLNRIVLTQNVIKRKPLYDYIKICTVYSIKSNLFEVDSIFGFYTFLSFCLKKKTINLNAAVLWTAKI